MDLVSVTTPDVYHFLTPLSHLLALKADDIQALKTKVGFPADQSFHIPQETYDVYAKAAARGAQSEKAWSELLASYAQKYPKEHAELTRRIRGELPQGWEQALPVYKSTDAAQASRKLSEIVLTAITPSLPSRSTREPGVSSNATLNAI